MIIHTLVFKRQDDGKLGLFLGDQVVGWVFKSFLVGGTFYSSSLLGSNGFFESFETEKKAHKFLVDMTIAWLSKAGIITIFNGE